MKTHAIVAVSVLLLAGYSSVSAYELTPKDSKILDTIIQRANDWIAKKWPEMREKYLIALHLYQQKYRDNERIGTIIWKAMDAISALPTEAQKNIVLQMITLCENAPETTFQYNYAENIGDGRGITFGIIGFTTGTFDGNILLHYYTKLQPQNNLKKYMPTLDTIDAGKHDADGKNDGTRGLDGFIEAVKVNRDPLFKKAQLDLLYSMYWNPAVKLSDQAGTQYLLSRAFIYDMTVNHGEEGARSLISTANQSMWGSPKNGINEKKWLLKLMDIRYAYLKKDYPEGLDRINAFRKLLNAGNTDLNAGFTFEVYGGTYRIDGEVY